MKNKTVLIKFATLLLALALCVGISLTACSQENEQESGEVETDEPFEPVSDNGEGSELGKRYAEYKENATLAFKNNAPMGKDAFTYEITDGKATIVKYIGTESVIVLPEKIDGATVAAIAEGAFSGGAIRAVYVPDSVKTIAQGAFDSCEGLSTLRLPFVGDGCENAFVGYIFGADEPDENSIALPPSLDMIIIGEGCESIADEAFKGAKTLSAVVLPQSVSKIGKMAFYQCLDLVYLSCDGVTEIDEYALAYCKALYSVDLSSTTSVAKGALFSCTAINAITLNLYEDDYLGRIFDAEGVEFNDELVPASLRAVTVAAGCKTIPNMAFYSCKYITEVNLPDSLETIGIRAFYACRSLRAVTIPDNVKMIRDDAFFGCDNLSELTLGGSLEIIGMQAFYGCGALKSVECPESLREIGASAFYGCKSLVSVDLGGTSGVGKDAFGDCPRLSPIDYSGVIVK